jgi:DNA-binding NarL/FixJ family response regulator
MVSKIRILIFEKSYLIKQGLASLINSFDNCEISEEFADGVQYVQAIRMYNPQIVFLSGDIGESIAIKDFKSLKRDSKHILVGLLAEPKPDKLSFFDDFFYYHDDRQSLSRKLNFYIQSISREESNKKAENHLSDREKDIVALVAKGLTNKEIANELFISIHTVITHRKNIGRKLGIKSVSGITVYAILNKLIDMKDLY